MPLIGERDRATISEMFQELTEPVRLVYFTVPKSLLYVPGRATCETCEDVQQLLEELASISDKLSLEVHNLEQERDEAGKHGVDRVPALVLARPEDGKVGGIRYFGAPAGNEFPTLLSDIRSLSRSETALSDLSREKLAAITEPLHIQVFVTPT